MNNSSYKWNYNFPQIAREYGLKLNGVETGILDWRLIGSYDTERLVKDNDFERLEAVIPHLTEAPLGAILNNSVLDSGISKYFCLAQLGLQYLSFCKDFLDKSVTSLRRNVYNSEKEKQKLIKTNRKKNEELLRMHKKVHKIEVNNEKRSEIYSCSKCTKNFVTSDFLNNHLERKHSECPQNINNDKNLVGNIKLELEIKQLKQKLNDAEKELQNHRDKYHETRETPSCSSLGIQTNLEEEKDKDESINELQSHRQMIMDSQYQLADLLKAQLKAMDEWKCSEKQRSQKDAQDVRNSLQEALNLMTQKRRVVLNKTKLDQYSIPAGKPESSESSEQLINEWKKKYHDLELSYKDGHEKLSYILNDLDKKNKDQRLLIEVLKKKPETKDFTVQVDIAKNKEDTFKLPVTVSSSYSKMFLSSLTESDDEEEETTKVVVFPKPKESIKISHDDQKVLAINKINLTLENLGIKSNQTSIEPDDFEKIKSKITRERSHKNKKFRNFSKIRNRLLDKIDDMADAKLEESKSVQSKISLFGESSSSKIPKRVNFKNFPK